MGSECSSDMTALDFAEKVYKWNKVAIWSAFCRSGVLFGCIFAVFGWNHRLKKQTFVKAIWFLFAVTGVVFLANAIISVKLLDALKELDGETAKKLTPYWIESVIIFEVTGMSAHWIFAIKYVETVLKLPLLFSSGLQRKDDTIFAKRKQIICIIRTLNCIFCMIVLAIMIIEQIIVFSGWERNLNLSFADALLPSAIILPSVVLLVAVIKLRCIVSKLGNKAIFEKEKTILVHSLIFGLFSLFSVAGGIAS